MLCMCILVPSPFVNIVSLHNNLVLFFLANYLHYALDSNLELSMKMDYNGLLDVFVFA
jgi:hypothetical protein